MNRENKFRAWDKKEKIMYEAGVINLFLDFMGDVYHTYKGKLNLVDTLILLQYTGLKDKNGKEIYEGDIVRREFEIGRVIIDPVSLGAEDYEIDDSGYFIGVVSFRPSEGYVLNKCKKYNDEDELQTKKSGVKLYANRAEVIGNIYENSELLEDKQ